MIKIKLPFFKSIFNHKFTETPLDNKESTSQYEKHPPFYTMYLTI